MRTPRQQPRRMDPPAVTVVTAVRNGVRHLGSAIASIRSQSFTEWEYIIVDDASEDGTPQIVEAAMQEDARIRLIRRDQGGSPFIAANEGLREARGRYIVRLDADDIAAPNRIERQLAFLESHPQLRACAGSTGLVTNRRLIGRSNMLPPSPAVVQWHLFVRRNLPHSSACVERAAFEEIGGYRELPAAQDFRMWCDLARRRWVGVTPDVVVYSRRHPDRLSRRRPDVQRDLAVEALGDHVAALTGEHWSRDELLVLWDLQRLSATPFREGLRVLQAWETAWRADTRLAHSDRRYLDRLKRTLLARLYFVREPIAPLLRKLMRRDVA